MVIDTSAIVAVLFDEPEAQKIAETIAIFAVLALPRRISTATLLEAAIVVEKRHGVAGGEKLDRFLEAAAVQVEPVTQEQCAIARLAFRTYGKGRHAAALNFGDCFSYALAKAVDEPLLFKGNDFMQTDVKIADSLS